MHIFSCGASAYTMYVSDGVQLQGIEDAQGNMDFKVAGTSEGITSLQVGKVFPSIHTVLDSRILSLAKNVVLLTAGHEEHSRNSIPRVPRCCHEIQGYFTLSYPAPLQWECLCVLTDARLRVLATMDQCQASPRPELKDNGPAYGNSVFLVFSFLYSLPLISPLLH